MCKLPGHIVKLIASMSSRRHHRSDDTSRHHRDVAPVSVPRPSQETAGSSAIARPDSSLPNRPPVTSRVRDDDAASRSPPESQVPRGGNERVDMEQKGQEPCRSTLSLTKDQGCTYPDEEGGTIMEDKLRPPREEDRHRYDEDLAGDRRDTLRSGLYYPSLKPEGDTGIYRPPLVHVKDAQPIIPSPAGFQRLLEAQSIQLGTLQQEHRAALEEKKALTDAYTALRQQYDERSMRLSVARHERQTALNQRKEIDDSYTTLNQQYDGQTRKLDAMRHEHQAALEQKQKVEEDYAALRQKYEAQKNEYDTLSNKFHSLKATLEQRTSELQGVQRFLTTADTFSGTEVVNALRRLNGEVQQSTAFMADWAVENFTLQAPPTDQTNMSNIEQTRTSETLGMRFMQLLGARKHKDNPILMEMAFRAYLMYELYWVASPWSIGDEEQSHNLYIDAIYQRIREAEGQAVSGNWRALTRTHTLPSCISDPEVARAFHTTIVSGFSDILLAAGCTTPKSDITAALWSKFGERIHHFVSLAGQVNKIIGVGVISEDFEVLVIWPDVVFDERAMEDAYDNGDRVQGTEEHEDIVLCATELGLMQRMSVGVGARQKEKPSELIVIKPKVALVSVINIIDE